MVLHLAEQLEVPLRDRNQLLLAGRLRAASTASARSTSPRWSPVREALDLVLRGHEPYPAVVVDRRWEHGRRQPRRRAAHRGRRAGAARAAGQRPARQPAPRRAWRRGSSTSPSGARTCSTACAARSSVTGDAALAALLRRAQRLPGAAARRATRAPAASRRPAAAAAPATRELRFFSTVATFGTAVDITRRRAVDRVVLPGRRRDGRGSARRLMRRTSVLPPPEGEDRRSASRATARAGSPPRRAAGRRQRRPSPARRPTPPAAPTGSTPKLTHTRRRSSPRGALVGEHAVGRVVEQRRACRARSAGDARRSAEQARGTGAGSSRGRRAAPRRCARPGSGGHGSHGSAGQPWPGPVVHGIGARQPSRPPGSTTRSGGTSRVLAGRAPRRRRGTACPRSVSSSTAAARARASSRQARAHARLVVVGEHPGRPARRP